MFLVDARRAKESGRTIATVTVTVALLLALQGCSTSETSYPSVDALTSAIADAGIVCNSSDPGVTPIIEVVDETATLITCYDYVAAWYPSGSEMLKRKSAAGEEFCSDPDNQSDLDAVEVWGANWGVSILGNITVLETKQEEITRQEENTQLASIWASEIGGTQQTRRDYACP